jgi:hypothetical protein
LIAVALANLIWETLHLPLYTLWTQGSAGEKAFAVLHCTGGDLLIALSCLVLALILVGDGAWPVRNFYRVAALTTLLGVAYTIFSEKFNIIVKKSWAYSEWMPVLPLIDIGLSPLMQWLVIPVAALAWSRRRVFG